MGRSRNLVFRVLRLHNRILACEGDRKTYPLNLVIWESLVVYRDLFAGADWKLDCGGLRGG